MGEIIRETLAIFNQEYVEYWHQIFFLMSSSMGRIIPYMNWKNKKCSKPPTSIYI
jgi:hypothetical protein